MKSTAKVFGVSLVSAALIGTALLSAFTTNAADPATMSKGEKIYKSYCVTCHQANGKGMPDVYPPLAKSDYLTKKSKTEIAQALIFGLSGKVQVNGKNFNGMMPPIPGNYTSADIAAVLTYVYNSWGNPGTVVTAQEVDQVKKQGKPKKK